MESTIQAKASEKTYRLAPFLSPLGVWAYGVGTAIGWGSFVVTSNQYLLQAGPLGSLLGIAGGTIVMVAIALNYAYLMQRYPNSGGSYTYVSHVLGKDRGFLTAWYLSLTYMSIFWANATSIPLFARYFFGDQFRFGYLYTIFGYDIYLGEVLLTLAASRIVCTHFAHSPVYRIGGDEFVAILEGSDYERRAELCAAFDREVEANIGTTNAVISAGLSIFDPALDVTFHEVFERADALMYQRKLQLKSMGAATRDSYAPVQEQTGTQS